MYNYNYNENILIKFKLLTKNYDRYKDIIERDDTVVVINFILKR